MYGFIQILILIPNIEPENYISQAVHMHVISIRTLLVIPKTNEKTFIQKRCNSGNRVALNPGLSGVRDVASVIILHEQTQSNRVCCFQTLNAVFPKDLFSDYFHILP